MSEIYEKMFVKEENVIWQNALWAVPAAKMYRYGNYCRVCHRP